MRAKFYCQGWECARSTLPVCARAYIRILCVYNNFILDGYAAFMYEIKNIRQRNMLSVRVCERAPPSRISSAVCALWRLSQQRMQIRKGLNIMIMDLGKTFSGESFKTPTIIIKRRRFAARRWQTFSSSAPRNKISRCQSSTLRMHFGATSLQSNRELL